MTIGSFLGLLAVLVILGVIIWGAQRILAVIPIAEPFRTVIWVVLVIAAVFICLSVLGLLPSGLGFHSGRVC